MKIRKKSGPVPLSVDKLEIGVKYRKIEASQILEVSRPTINKMVLDGRLKYENRRVIREV